MRREIELFWFHFELMCIKIANCKNSIASSAHHYMYEAFRHRQCLSEQINKLV